MPGIVAGPKPTLVMPQNLCTAFEESKDFRSEQNLYCDGSVEFGARANVFRTTFKLNQRLSPAKTADLLQFYLQVGTVEAFIYYNPFEGTPVGSNYDASGQSTVGRYIVAFRNDWTHTANVSRADVGQLELVDLGSVDSYWGRYNGFGTNGSVTGMTLFLTSEHIVSGATGNFGAGASFDGVATIAPVPTWFHSTAGWAKKTDSISLTSRSDQVYNGTFFLLLMLENDGTGTTADEEFRLYDAYITIGFADGTTETWRPGSNAQSMNNATGSISNAGNLTDADPSTYASLIVHNYGGAGLGGAFLNVSAFSKV